MVKALLALDFLGEPFIEDHEDTLHDRLLNDLSQSLRNWLCCELYASQLMLS